MNVLFSIKPQYAKRIFDGTKKYEFRKIRCKQSIEKMYIYVTSPICAVMGECIVTGILQDSPESLWGVVSRDAGISEIEYIKYFDYCERAIAYKLEHIVQYDRPKKLNEFNVKNPPQSFFYCKE